MLNGTPRQRIMSKIRRSPMRFATHASVIGAVLLFAAPGIAQQNTKLTLADYLEWESVSNPQISPDGRQIIFSRRWVDKQNDRWESSLYIMNVDGSRLRKLTDGSNAIWSPQGDRV